MKAYSLDLRQKIVDVHEQEEISQRQLAKRFQVSLSTVQRLLKRQRNGENLAPKVHGGGHPSRLSQEQVEKVREIVESHNDATLEELCDMMAQAENESFNNGSFSSVVKTHSQKKTFHARERYTQRVQKLRVEYWHTIGEVKLEDLIFLDEAGVNLSMRRQYARSQRGTRAYSQVSAQRGKNVTLIGGLTYQGFIAPMTWQGGTNGTTFQTYIDKILVPQLWEGACVVMDNFSSHLICGVRESIEAVGAKLVYLSPYSPDFSPIENCWSKLKASVRAQAVQTYEELNQAIAIALDQITQKDLVGWFTHCCYCIQCN